MSTAEVQKTFDDLDPTSPLGGVVRCKPNNPQFYTVTSTVMVPSRVKAGQMVEIALTKNQQNRVPLNQRELDLVDMIENDIPSYKLALIQTQESLFGAPFQITLRKKDVFKVKSGPKSKPKRGQPTMESVRRGSFRDEEEEPSSSSDSSKSASEEPEPVKSKKGKKGKGGKKSNKSEEEEQLQTVDDQPENILLPEIARQVQEKNWLPPCKEIMSRLQKVGVCPIFLLPKEITVSTYSKGDGGSGKSAEQSGEGESSVGAEDERYDYESTGEYPPEEDTRGGSQEDDDFEYEKETLGVSKSREASKEEKMYEWYDMDTESAKDAKIDKKMKKALRKNSGVYPATRGELQTTNDRKYTNYTMDALPEATDKKKKGKTKYTDEEMKKKLEIVGTSPKDALEAFGIAYERDYERPEAPLKVPLSGTIVNEEVGPSPNLASLLSTMNTDPRSTFHGAIESIGAPSIAHEVQAPNTFNGNKPTESMDPGGKRDGKSEGKKRKLKEISKSKGDRSPKRRKKESKTSRGNGPSINPVDVTETHWVPVVPPTRNGTIEIYEDIFGPRFVWTWKNTKDEYEGKMEPNMLWIVKYTPRLDGTLTSPLASMIPEFVVCEDGKRQRAEAVKDSKNPLFVVTRPEQKLAYRSNGGLTDENYVTMATGTVAGGGPTIYKPGSLGVDANTGALFPAQQRWGDTNHAQSLLPSGYRSIDGPGVVNDYNTGALMDRNSREFRMGYGNVRAANLLNGVYGDPGEIVRGNQQRQREKQAALNAAKQKMGILDPDSVVAENLAQAEANVTQNYVNRETVKIPRGTIMFLEPGETLTEMKMEHDYLENVVEASRERLDKMAAIWGGFPLGSLYDPKSQKGPDGAFSTKTTSSSANASNYGLGVTHVMQSPTKDYITGFQNQYKTFFQIIIKSLFSLSYASVFKTKEKFWQKLLQNTFKMNPSSDLSRRNAKNQTDVGVNSLPSFQTFFEVQVTFPFTDSIGLSSAIDLWKFGVYEAEDLIPFMASMDNGSIIPQQCIRIIQERKGTMDIEAMRKRVNNNMNELKELEKEKVKKPEPAGAGAKPKAKKKSSNKGK